MNKNKKKWIGILLLIITLLLGTFLFIPKIKSNEVPKQIVNNAVIQNLDKNKIAIIEINGVKYEGDVDENTSVYNFMFKLQNENKINFKDITYTGMGKFIKEINGVKNSRDKSWIYYVNNKKAMIGVSNYQVKPGDIVSWKYESSMN